jgi:hypothetical protein
MAKLGDKENLIIWIILIRVIKFSYYAFAFLLRSTQGISNRGAILTRMVKFDFFCYFFRSSRIASLSFFP